MRAPARLRYTATAIAWRKDLRAFSTSGLITYAESMFFQIVGTGAIFGCCSRNPFDLFPSKRVRYSAKFDYATAWDTVPHHWRQFPCRRSWILHRSLC